MIDFKPLSCKINTIDEERRETGSLNLQANERGDHHWKDSKFNRDLNSINFDVDYLHEIYEITIINIPNIESVYNCIVKTLNQCLNF